MKLTWAVSAWLQNFLLFKSEKAFEFKLEMLTNWLRSNRFFRRQKNRFQRSSSGQKKLMSLNVTASIMSKFGSKHVFVLDCGLTVNVV